MQCLLCGYENRPGDNYCDGCGGGLFASWDEHLLEAKQDFVKAYHGLSPEHRAEFVRAMRQEPLELAPIGEVPEVLRAVNLYYRVLDLQCEMAGD